MGQCVKRFHEVLLHQNTNKNNQTRKWMLAAIADSSTIQFKDINEASWLWDDWFHGIMGWKGRQPPGTRSWTQSSGKLSHVTQEKTEPGPQFDGYEVEEVIFKHPRSPTIVLEVRNAQDQHVIIKKSTRVEVEVNILNHLEKKQVPHVPRCIASTYLIMTPVGSTSR